MNSELWYDAIVSYCNFWNDVNHKQKDGNRQNSIYVQRLIAVKCNCQIANIIDDSGGVITVMPVSVECYRR